MNDARWIAADRLDARLWCLRTYGTGSLFRGSPGTDKDNVGTRLAGDLARPGGETSNQQDALFEELAGWTTELNLLNSPALRTGKEVQP